jgi:hypothetical protein
MNYIQAYYDLPLTIVNSETKTEYIDALVQTRSKEDILVFRDFMKKEYESYLSNEIEKYEKEIQSKNNKGFFFLF